MLAMLIMLMLEHIVDTPQKRLELELQIAAPTEQLLTETAAHIDMYTMCIQV